MGPAKSALQEKSKRSRRVPIHANSGALVCALVLDLQLLGDCASHGSARHELAGISSKFRGYCASESPHRRTNCGGLGLRGGQDNAERPTEGFELLFLGTGVSTGLPKLGCIVRERQGDAEPCVVCHDALNTTSKNRRCNVSVLIRVPQVFPARPPARPRPAPERRMTARTRAGGRQRAAHHDRPSAPRIDHATRHATDWSSVWTAKQ